MQLFNNLKGPLYRTLSVFFNSSKYLIILWYFNPKYEFYLSQQEPSGNATEIMNALRHVRPGGGFVPAFPMFNRVHVSGSEAIPLFKWVLVSFDDILYIIKLNVQKEQCPIAPQITFSKRWNLRYEPISAEDIRWNFEKVSFITRYKLLIFVCTISNLIEL